jgi:diguanylate cyclase (GGDEF)-like protein
MLTEIIHFELFLIVSITAILVFIGAFLKKDTDLFKSILLNFSVFFVALIIGSTIRDIDDSTLWLLSYIVFGMMLFILVSTPVTTTGLIISNAISTSIVLLIPFENIAFAEDGIISLNSILFVMTILIYIGVYSQIKKKGTNFHRNMFAVISIGIITSYIVDPVYHLTVMTILFSIILWFVTDKVIDENNTSDEALSEKLQKLETEFNYEVRREVNKHTFHLKEVQEKMSHINKIDNLTQTFNKKAILDLIEEFIEDRRVEQFSVIMFDLDNFKNLNDTLGHVQGDICLKTLSSFAKECIRDSDSIGRYGGDEFLIVLPKASLSTAVTIAERFRTKICKDTQPHFTVSIGLSCFPEDGKTLKELLDTADRGLYRSKEKGRNAVSYDNPKYEKKY